MGESQPAGLSHAIFAPGDGSVLITLDGELDIGTVEELRAGVADAIATVRTQLVLDVQNLRFVDSSGIALWVGWARAVPRIEIHEAHPLVMRVIQTMGLTEILNPS